MGQYPSLQATSAEHLLWMLSTGLAPVVFRASWRSAILFFSFLILRKYLKNLRVDTGTHQVCDAKSLPRSALASMLSAVVALASKHRQVHIDVSKTREAPGSCCLGNRMGTNHFGVPKSRTCRVIHRGSHGSDLEDRLQACQRAKGGAPKETRLCVGQTMAHGPLDEKCVLPKRKAAFKAVSTAKDNLIPILRSERKQLRDGS